MLLTLVVLLVNNQMFAPSVPGQLPLLAPLLNLVAPSPTPTTPTPSLPPDLSRTLEDVRAAAQRAEEAQAAAQAAAQELFAAKRAEVEALALLSGDAAKPTKGKGGKGDKDKDKEPPAESPEAAAQELLRLNASAACAEALRRAEEAAMRAAKAAEEARAAEESARAAMDAAAGQGPDARLEASVQARAAAEAARDKVGEERG